MFGTMKIKKGVIRRLFAALMVGVLMYPAILFDILMMPVYYVFWGRNYFDEKDGLLISMINYFKK